MTLPSVLLHDHLDGGLRPDTLIDLATAAGHRLPTDDPDALARAMDQRQTGSLEEYLAAFTHTIAAMQTTDALHRVAVEAVEDLAADGVVYAELRFAPRLHTQRGLDPREVLEAVLDGIAGAADRVGMAWGVIVDAIRSDPASEPVAELAGAYADDGVVGFDLAGPEAGFPPDDHLPAIRRARELGLRITLHGGEAGGLGSLAAAVDAGAERIGHGVEVVDDCVTEGDEIVSLGRVASRIRDRRIPLEVCPSSNLATRGWRAEEHPVGILHRAGFRVTINTDNRLMSATGQAAELALVRQHHGFGIDDLAVVTRTALGAAFCPEPLRRRLWEERIAPAYREAGAAVSPRW